MSQSNQGNVFVHDVLLACSGVLAVGLFLQVSATVGAQAMATTLRTWAQSIPWLAAGYGSLEGAAWQHRRDQEAAEVANSDGAVNRPPQGFTPAAMAAAAREAGVNERDVAAILASARRP